MDRAKEAIAKSFEGNEQRYEAIFKIINNRWNVQLHRPLHAAGWYLNPEFFDQIEGADSKVVNGLLECIRKLVPDLELQNKIDDEITMYTEAQGLFGNYMAVRKRKIKSPGIHFCKIITFFYTIKTQIASY